MLTEVGKGVTLRRMKWEAYWWGIKILAENEADAKLLRQLAEKIPEGVTPEVTYEDGVMETENLDTESAVIILNR